MIATLRSQHLIQTHAVQKRNTPAGQAEQTDDEVAPSPAQNVPATRHAAHHQHKSSMCQRMHEIVRRMLQTMPALVSAGLHDWHASLKTFTHIQAHAVLPDT